jgi:hypothetical protein
MTLDDLRFVLMVSVFLIVLGLVSIGIADHYNWRDLAGAGGIVLGYGGGILQGKGTTHNETKTGDVVNEAATPKT